MKMNKKTLKVFLKATGLKSWDGNCPICGKPIPDSDCYKNGSPHFTEGDVIGEYFPVWGHKKCVEYVQKVLMENRKRVAKEFIALERVHKNEFRSIANTLKKMMKMAKVKPPQSSEYRRIDLE